MHNTQFALCFVPCILFIMSIVFVPYIMYYITIATNKQKADRNS